MLVKVFYSGVWDLLHVGHVRALKAAAECGDWLTVGVVIDDFDSSYKTLPTIPLEQRMEMVAELCFVDEVVPHRWWDDNVDFMLENGFSIRAHGPQHGKQHPLQLEVWQKLQSHGIQYVEIPRTEGISTTIIRERIRKNETLSSIRPANADSAHRVLG